MNPQNFNDVETLVGLPAIIAAKPRAPQTDKIRISPMRLRAMQTMVRADVFPVANTQPLRATMQQVFMLATMWYHAHLDEAMAPRITNALQHIHDAGQGLFVDQSILFVDLRQVAMSPAGNDADVTNAIQAAEQALLARIMQ